MSITLLPRTPITDALGKRAKAREAEKAAAYEMIDALKGSLAEMLEIYWGTGDGIDPPPACIIRAMHLLSNEVLS